MGRAPPDGAGGADGTGGADTGAEGGADTEAAGGADTGMVSSVDSRTGSLPAPLGPWTPAPLTGERIGDGRRVRNHADSTARKMGSSIVSSGRGTTAPFSLPFTASWP